MQPVGSADRLPFLPGSRGLFAWLAGRCTLRRRGSWRGSPDCEAGTEDIADEWFLGPFLLVAPVLDAGSSRTVFLPSGRWFDYADGKTVYEGGGQIAYRAGLWRTPVFVKAGSIIPTGPAMQYSSEKPLDPLTLDVYPAREPSSFVLFEDDGEYGYEQGQYATTRYDCVDTNGTVIVAIHAREAHGGYSPERRQYVVRVHGRGSAPLTVALNREPSRNWSYQPEEEVTTVTIDDDGGENVLTIGPWVEGGGGSAPVHSRRD